jgi:hypothetical protein
MRRVKMAYRLTMAFHKRGTLLVFGVTNSLHFNKEKVISPLNIRPDSGSRKETDGCPRNRRDETKGRENCEFFRI